MKNKLLEVEGLTVEFPTKSGPKTVVKNMSFQLDAGDRLGIVGESGSGKSMTALALMGLLPNLGKICSGSIKYNGIESNGDRAALLAPRRPIFGRPEDGSTCPHCNKQFINYSAMKTHMFRAHGVSNPVRVLFTGTLGHPGQKPRMSLVGESR